MEAQRETPSSALFNLIFNIIAPVYLLKQSERFEVWFGPKGPVIALLIAIALPLSYGLFEYIKFKKRNLISALGFTNTLITGCFALYQVEGKWFAIKEASFPLLIGIFVYLSVRMKRPFIEYMVYNRNFMDLDLLEAKVRENGTEKEIHRHLRKSTIFLGHSFILSAVLNFVLAIFIFKKIDPSLSETQHAKVLNEQISHMTWLSYLVILIPSMIALMWVLKYLSDGLKKYSGLSLPDVMIDKKPSPAQPAGLIPPSAETVSPPPSTGEKK